MANYLPTSPVPSFTYIGSFVVDTEDDVDDDVVHSIPPSPIEVGIEYHSDTDDSPTSIDDDAGVIDPVDESSVVDEDYNIDDGCIDHTALLLGCYEYEEEDDDDEREWNGSFSLDELDRTTDVYTDEVEPTQEVSQNNVTADINDYYNNSDGGIYASDDTELSSIDVGEREEEVKDDRSCASELVHFDDGIIVSDNLPVSTATHTTTSTNNASTMQQFKAPPRQRQVVSHASSLPINIYSATPPPTNPSLRRCDTSSSRMLSSQPSMIQNDVWRREEEEQRAYATMPRKKINTFENKKKMATMKALAMKERAGSALASRATRAKDKLKEKMSISAKNIPLQVDDRFHNHRPGQKTTIAMHGMEISARDDDNHTNITSLMSSEVSPSTSSLSNLPTKTKKAHMMSRAFSSLSSEASLPKDGMATTTNTTYYGSLSHRAHLAKAKALGTMNGVLTAAVSSTSSATSSTSSSSSMNRRQQSNDKKIAKQQIIDTVFSMEDEDIMSDIPSVLNSEGPSSIQDISYDGRSITMVSVPGDGRDIIVNNSNNNIAYSTPKTRSGTRKQGGGKEVDGGRMHHNTIGEPMSSACMISPAHIYSPEQILANLSNIVPTAAVESCNSMIDGGGFLISPTPASIHRRWDEEDSRQEDVASSSQRILPTVGSAVSSEGGGSSAFDPNSFLFLSPLSDHDLDDPDYGMPFLLSRSNSHNAVVMDSTTPTRPSVAGLPPPPPPGPSTMTTTTMTSEDNPKSSSRMKSTSSPSPTMSNSKRLLMRFPPSPRIVPSPKLLPPSGKKMMQKMKMSSGAGGGRGGDIVVKHGSSCLNTSRPAPIQHRAQSSTF